MGEIGTTGRGTWHKAILVISLLLVVAGLVAWALSSASPNWYAEQRSTPADESLARSVEDQLQAVASWAELTYVQEKARQKGRRLEVPAPPDAFVLALSHEQLNAFARKWVPLASVQEGGVSVAGVCVQLLAGEARIGFQLPQWSGQRVISVALRDSSAALAVSSPHIGLLPVPTSLLPIDSPHAAKAAGDAEMDEAGKGDNDCVEAAWQRIVSQLLAGRLSEDRCFLPQPTPIAVRVERHLEAGRLRLTIRPLTRAEREQYLLDLKSH